MNKIILKTFIAFAVILISQISIAQNNKVIIEIDPGKERKAIPVAIVPFAGSQGLPHNIHEIVANDLRMSGKFEPLSADRFLALPSREEDVQFKDWRTIGVELLAIGQVTPIGGQNYQVTFLLYDVAQQTRIGGYRYNVTAGGVRNVAHQISNYIYQKRTGREGVFTSKIAFIKRTGKQSQLQVADWDGFGAQTVVTSNDPVFSPEWSADGSKIAFVTIQKGRSLIKVIELSSGRISTLVNSSRGFNSAPSWSPDGQKLAFASSRSGNSEIYVFDFASKSTRKITNHWGIDTEPAWTSDGGSVIFTSGRSGKANIYEVSAFGGEARRITFTGKENGDADVSPDGQNVVVVRDGGIAMLNRNGQLVRTLYASGFDESPSFSANGDMVLFGIKQGYNGSLVVSSADGRAKQTLNALSGNVQDAVWSPNK